MTLKFISPLELERPTVETMLARAWPETTAENRLLAITDGRLKIEEIKFIHPKEAVPPLCEIEVEEDDVLDDFDIPTSVLARGDDWLIVEKPFPYPTTIDRTDPMNPMLFFADTTGVDRETFRPWYRVPANYRGPWGWATDDEAHSNWFERIKTGAWIMQFSALVESEFAPLGRFVDSGITVESRMGSKRGNITEIILQLHLPDNTLQIEPVDFLLEFLAEQKAPCVGDRERMGAMIDGGLRLRLSALYSQDGTLGHAWNAPRDWFTDEQVFADHEQLPTTDPSHVQATGEMIVSPKTLEVLAKGHPWILRDGKTSKGNWRAGDLVQLIDTGGKRGPLAVYEGDGELAARVWGSGKPNKDAFIEEALIRFDEALAKRSDLMSNLVETDLFRLVHGAADGLPGFVLDRVGPLYRATITGGASHGFKNAVYDALREFEPDAMVLEVHHEADVRHAELPNATIVAHGAAYVPPGERVIGHEAGFRYWCDPWEGIDVGFFADQRDNRQKLRDWVEPGQRWLNLFCHTGAFSVVLADLGAIVHNVDVSKNYLEWLDQNMELNNVGSDYENHAADARTFLKKTVHMYDGIIVDPPTAASGDKFWSIRRDYPDLLEQCFSRLNHNGLMLVCRNDKKQKPPLSTLIQNMADRRVKMESCEPSPDFPLLKGFPEGDKFEGFWVRN